MIRAFRGELGLKVYAHAPYIHALPPQPVQIEPGDEALYPTATEYVLADRAHDDERRGPPRVPSRPRSRFVPEPYERRGITCDVVVCPRMRAYGASKNWPHWGALADTLAGSFDVFAAGAPDSSDDVSVPRAWDLDRFLDASIEAIRSARLVIATDAGLAHLAVLCGTPLLLITHEGRTAPGPVTDPDGAVMQPSYGPVKMHRYHEANHTGAPIHTEPKGWTCPESVAALASRLLA